MSKWAVYVSDDNAIRTVHMVPEGDLFPHEQCNCPCETKMEVVQCPDGFVSFNYTHNAYDGRP